MVKPRTKSWDPGLNLDSPSELVRSELKRAYFNEAL